MRKLLLILSIVFTSLIYFSCDTTENPQDQNNTDIPGDPTGVTVPTPTKNNVLPSASFSTTGSRVKLNLLGLIDPTTNQPLTLSYNATTPQSSNIFVEEDGIVQGLKVTKVGTGNVLTADIVFTVDNSGSMSEEADSVAASIIQFASFLQASGLDVKFAVVGYDGRVYGAINFTNAQSLSNYLNRSTGTSRTEGFSGPDSASLQNKSYVFAQTVYGENGVVAVLFADSMFSWRAGAQRVFINFTDESTQPDQDLFWNTNKMCGLIGGKATVHTVYSGPADTSSGINGAWGVFDERPWEMSKCTGGTIKFIPEDATGLSLKDLPVAGALANSYLVEYVSAKTGVAHTVKITIYTSTADGVQTFNITY